MKLLRRLSWLVVLPGLLLGIVGCGDDDDINNGTGPEVHTTKTNISGNLTKNLTTDESPYLMTGNVVVPEGAVVTVQPGVEVYAKGNYVFEVKGTLEAVGSENQMILFTSQKVNPNRGEWKGIWLNGADDGSILEYVHVSYAAKYNIIEDTTRVRDNGEADIDTVLQRGAVSLHNTGATVKRCVIDFGGYDGIQVVGLSPSGALPKIEYNTIANNAFNGIRIEPDWYAWERMGQTGVGSARIHNNIIVMNDDAGIRLPEDDEETSDGGVMSIYTEGLIPELGYNNIWNNASLNYVPPAWVDPSSGLAPEGLVLDFHVNPLFIDGENGDYHLHPCSGAIDRANPEDPTDSDGTIADVGIFPLLQGPYDLAKTLKGDKLTLSGGQYRVRCDVTIEVGDVLTVAPGTEILFEDAYKFIVKGKIDAQGSAADKILFSSLKKNEDVDGEPARADWKQLVLDHADDTSILDNVIIEYASMDRVDKPSPDTLGALSVIASAPTIRNVMIRDSYYVGFYLFDGANPSVENLTIENVGYHGAVLKLASNPTMSNVLVRGVQGYGILFENSSPTISNMLVSNTMGTGLVIRNNSSPVIDHATVYGRFEQDRNAEELNLTGFAHYGIKTTLYSRPVITNSIISEFATYGLESSVSSMPVINTSLIHSTKGGSGATLGNINASGMLESADPGFTNGQGGDFTLKANSPAKSAATDGSDLGATGALLGL